MDNMQYYQVFISAENKEQATCILDALLKHKLVLGGPILEGPAKFWWKDGIVSMDYVYLVTYTSASHRERVIEIAEEASAEEVPMISFIPFEGNRKLLQLLEKTFSN